MTPMDLVQREEEIQKAAKEYPGVEIGEAYRKWKEAQGETAIFLQTDDRTIEVSKKLIKEAAKKPCTQDGCAGTMELEAICGSCVEGRLGWKTKWTCDVCLYRELSKKDFLEWLRELSSSSKE